MKIFYLFPLLLLMGCGSGGGGEDIAPAPVAESTYYSLDNPLPYSTNYETITVFDDTGTEHNIDRFNRLFNDVMECMGMGSDYPRLYLVDTLPNGATGNTVFAGEHDASQWINITRGSLIPRTLTHEFIHYILFYNLVLSGLNNDHQAYYFDVCIIDEFYL